MVKWGWEAMKMRDSSCFWSWRTRCVYERMWSCARRLHGIKCWEGKKQCVCNKDEYANYKQGQDYTWKNAWLAFKRNKRKIATAEGNCEKHRLLEATRKADEVMNKIEVGNIIELNDLVCADTMVVTEVLGAKNRKSTGIKPWWKRRTEAQVYIY